MINESPCNGHCMTQKPRWSLLSFKLIVSFVWAALLRYSSVTPPIVSYHNVSIIYNLKPNLQRLRILTLWRRPGHIGIHRPCCTKISFLRNPMIKSSWTSAMEFTKNQVLLLLGVISWYGCRSWYDNVWVFMQGGLSLNFASWKLLLPLTRRVLEVS